MKKIFYSMMAVAAMFATTSCSNDDFGSNGPEANVTFTTELEGLNAGRSIADGNTVNKMVFEVYDEAGKRFDDLRQVVDVTSGKANVSTRLVSNKTYKVAFFAYNEDGAYYNVDSLTNVKIQKDYQGNDEARDAFFASETVTPKANEAVTVTLKRPFAQLNFVAKDVDAAKKAGAALPAKATLTVSNVYSAFNVLEGDVTGTPATLNIAEGNPVGENETITIGTSKYGNLAYVSMNYLLVSKAQALSDATINISDDNGTPITTLNVPNLPVQANYRTNIVGSLFTNSRDYEIIVDGAFAGDIDVNTWDGKYVTGATSENRKMPSSFVINEDDYTITIKDAAALAYLATYDMKWDTEGVNKYYYTWLWTVKLDADIDLNGNEWNPLALPYKEFDGQGHTIYNLKINKPEDSSVGMFNDRFYVRNLNIVNADITGKDNVATVIGSYGSAKNVHVTNATIKGNKYVGGICGISAGSSYENCSLTNSSITATSKEVGGICGFVTTEEQAGNHIVVDGCRVENSTITGSEEVGGVVGRALAADNIDNSVTISRFTVKDVTVSATTSNAEKYVGQVLGRNYYDNDKVIVGTGSYSVKTSSDLVESVKNGGTVEVANNITLDGTNPLTTTGDVTIKAPEGKTVKIVGLGKTEDGGLEIQSTFNAGTIVFDGITFKVDAYTKGWAISSLIGGTAKVTFKNCIFDGIQCPIYQSGADAVVTFENCTFNISEPATAIQAEVYSGDFQLGQDMIIKNCDFGSTARVLHIYDYDKNPSTEAIDAYLKANGNTFTGTVKQTCTK